MDGQVARNGVMTYQFHSALNRWEESRSKLAKLEKLVRSGHRPS